jgi:hypothetical protein
MVGVDFVAGDAVNGIPANVTLPAEKTPAMLKQRAIKKEGTGDRNCTMEPFLDRAANLETRRQRLLIRVQIYHKTQAI